MKTIKLFLATILLCSGNFLVAQQHELSPDLTKIINSDLWVSYNRDIIPDKDVHLDGKPGYGLLWIKEPVFKNGRIEFDIKGNDKQGKSFVGLAFHGLNDSTYEAIYFRPFNFKSPDKYENSIQYISHPEYPWFKLRKNYPKKYESTISPVPQPNDWFHVTIIINYPSVKVFVNNSERPSLMIEQISSRKAGWVGFWVGHNSEGYFKNLKIIQ